MVPGGHATMPCSTAAHPACRPAGNIAPPLVPQEEQIGSVSSSLRCLLHCATLVLCSIRFSLLQEEEQAALAGGAPLASAQLRSRYWRIRDAAGRVVNEVRGEAVVGQYPLLRPGELLTDGAADWEAESCHACNGQASAAHRLTPRRLQPSWPHISLVPPRPPLRLPSRRARVCLPVVHAPARVQGVHGGLLLLRRGFAAGEAPAPCARGSSASPGLRYAAQHRVAALLGKAVCVRPCCVASQLRPAVPPPRNLALQAPGREFDAVCAPFRLDVPDFIF